MSSRGEGTVYEADAVRRIDAAAIAGGIAGSALMQRAAQAAWLHGRQRWPGAQRIAVLCGPGHNGGDGYALALLATAAGCTVRLFQWQDPPQSDTAAPFVRAWRAQGGLIEAAEAAAGWTPDLWVDALLGIGLNRAPPDDLATLIESVNAHPAPVLAMDVPSGLNASTGAQPGAAIQAALTVSFIAHKLGLWTGAGPHFAGTRMLASLDVPPQAFANIAPAATLIDAVTGDDLPRRRQHAHKGQHGHVLVVGGNTGAIGAVLLAGRAALRGGAGYVSVATRSEHVAALVAAQPELMVHGIDQVDTLMPLLRKASVVAIGPGLGQDRWARALLDAAISSGRPAVIDADGLNLLAQRPQQLGGTVLTPHPGEAARLLGATVVEVEHNRLNAVHRLAQGYGSTAVLKGAGSLVSDGRRTACCPTGNPGMAVAGMGDALTGVIAALMAQGMAPFDAARAGVRVHADSGDWVAARRGPRGMLPGDVIDVLGRFLNP
jgi:ADP-dependent NAD(P)H-hydrate dehydratase / NAD(P)H-hydrate epimerase